MKPSPLTLERGRLLLLLGLAALALLWKARLVQARLVGDMSDDGPNRGVNAELLRNYYQLVSAGPERGGAGEVLADRIIPGRARPTRVRLIGTPATRTTPTTQFVKYEAVPGADIVDGGVRVQINRWGQRDRDYEQQKPPGTFRIALVGASNEMGWGVEQWQTYENFLEQRLNREFSQNNGMHYEVLNFSMAAHSLVELLYVFETRAITFQPDLVLVTFTAQDARRVIAGQLADRIRSGRELRYDFLTRAVSDAGARREDSASGLLRKLYPHWRSIVDGCFAGYAALGREHQIPVGIILLGLEQRPHMEPELDWGLQAAHRHGLAALRISQAMTKGKPAEMYLNPDLDRHPSAKAHALIADELFTLITTHERFGPLVRDAVPTKAK